MIGIAIPEPSTRPIWIAKKKKFNSLGFLRLMQLYSGLKNLKIKYLL
jgi:hypothetical protein